MTIRTLPDGRVVDFGDLSDSQIDQIVAREAAPAAPGSWLSGLGREAGIAGTRLLAPTAGLVHQIPEVGNYAPSYSDVMAMGPTPQGIGENILAAGATGLGYALPAAALMAGMGEAAGIGAGVLPFLAGSTGGAAAGEARRQLFPGAPYGGAMDLALGMGVGGGLGGLTYRALGGGAAAAPFTRDLFGNPIGRGIGPGARGLISTGVAEGAELLGRFFGLPAGIAQLGSLPVGYLTGRLLGGSGPSLMSAYPAGAFAGGLTSTLLGPSGSEETAQPAR